MGIVIGITHLKDLNEDAHPLAHDWPAIRAWGLDSLAHYSGISRTAGCLRSRRLKRPSPKSCMKQNNLSSTKKSS